jgi:hypothetical protein
MVAQRCDLLRLVCFTEQRVDRHEKSLADELMDGIIMDSYCMDGIIMDSYCRLLWIIIITTIRKTTCYCRLFNSNYNRYY